MFLELFASSLRVAIFPITWFYCLPVDDCFLHFLVIAFIHLKHLFCIFLSPNESGNMPLDWRGYGIEIDLCNQDSRQSSYFVFQVIEFVQFKERLQRSNQYLFARVETPILQLKQKADNIEEEEVCITFICFNTIPLCLMNMLPFRVFLKTWMAGFTLLSSPMRLDPKPWHSMKISNHGLGGHQLQRKIIS